MAPAGRSRCPGVPFAAHRTRSKADAEFTAARGARGGRLPDRRLDMERGAHADVFWRLLGGGAFGLLVVRYSANHWIGSAGLRKRRVGRRARAARLAAARLAVARPDRSRDAAAHRTLTSSDMPSLRAARRVPSLRFRCSRRFRFSRFRGSASDARALAA